MAAVGRWNSVRGKNVSLTTSDFDGTLSASDINVQLALDTLDDNTGGAGSLDTSNFDGILSVADTTIQLAMDTIDDHVHASIISGSALATITADGLDITDGTDTVSINIASGVLEIINTNHGGGLKLKAEDANGNVKSVIEGDTDGITTIYYQGDECIQTVGAGISIYDPGTSNVVNIRYSASQWQFMSQAPHGTPVALVSENDSGVAKDLLVADPEGAATLYYNGTWAVETRLDGININDNNLNSCGLYYSGANFHIYNTDTSGWIKLQGENNPSGQVDMITADPDGAATLYYAGTVAFATTAAGVSITNGTSTATLDYNGTTMVLKNTAVSGYVGIHGVSSGSANRIFLNMNPNGSVQIYHPQGNTINLTTLTNGIQVSGGGGICTLGRDGTDVVLDTTGTAASDLVLTCGADKTLELTTPVYTDLSVPASFISFGGVSDATEVAYKSGTAASFSTSSDNTVYITLQLPHSYKEGTDLVLHIHWTVNASGSGGGAENVAWNASASASSPTGDGSESWPAPTNYTEVIVDVQDWVADEHHVTNLATIDGTNFKVSEVILVSIRRNISVANDYGDTALVVSVDAHYQVDTIGSRQITTK